MLAILARLPDGKDLLRLESTCTELRRLVAGRERDRDRALAAQVQGAAEEQAVVVAPRRFRRRPAGHELEGDVRVGRTTTEGTQVPDPPLVSDGSTYLPIMAFHPSSTGSSILFIGEAR
ncbi:hypothetical protein ZWY2020_001495 [Hordeum vulgare]|nr:hypothetical protein ZWY2020_001495 [Hordeum vulgare]